MGTEKLHRHHVVQQFFYVLEGRAEFTFNEKCEFLAKGQGIHVPAGTKHKICNAEKELLQFLVISEPNAHADRENIE